MRDMKKMWGVDFVEDMGGGPEEDEFGEKEFERVLRQEEELRMKEENEKGRRWNKERERMIDWERYE